VRRFLAITHAKGQAGGGVLDEVDARERRRPVLVEIRCRDQADARVRVGHAVDVDGLLVLRDHVRRLHLGFGTRDASTHVVSVA